MLEVFRRVGFVPRVCGWELTLRCNLGCTHCGSLAGRARDDELTLDECLRLADDLVELRCQRVTLTGGEPTLHPGWDQIAERLSQQKVRVALISNGWAWQASDAERAVHAGIGTLGFSLDGLRAEHDAFRASGSYARVLDAIASARASGMEVAVNTAIHRRNRHQLVEIRDLLVEAGVRSWQLQYAIPTGAMAAHRDLVLPAEDLLWLVPQIAEFCRERKGRMYIVASDHIGYFGKPEAQLRQADVSMPFWLGCWAGMHVLGIESNGNVKGCLSLPSDRHGHAGFVEGNVRTESLRDIWRRKTGFRYNRDFRMDDLRGFCRVCRYGDVCRGGCTWKRHSQTDPDAGDTYCFYYQASKHRRHDLLDDEPTDAETAYLGASSG
jgi:radical SAM protein with 4Fe4S-binding SPASM domain